MSVFDPYTTVDFVQKRHPALLQVLKSSGLYRDGDPVDVSLAELTLPFGLHPDIIIRMLDTVDARVVGEAPPIDTAPFAAMTLGELVSHIEETHHVYLRREMPQVAEVTAKVARVHGERKPYLVELNETVQTLISELETHLSHEEDSLFAMIRDIETKGEISPTPCGDAVGGPISCMETDHERTLAALKQIRSLTGDYAVPDDACNSHRRMLAGLGQLDRDLIEHMYKENHLLFPRALEAQRGLGGGQATQAQAAE